MAELSNLSEAYIPQVKNGKRPPSQKLLDILEGHGRLSRSGKDYYHLFIQSRLAKEVSRQC